MFINTRISLLLQIKRIRGYYFTIVCEHIVIFRQSSRFNFRTSKQSSFYIFEVFVDSRGREGTELVDYVFGVL